MKRLEAKNKKLLMKAGENLSTDQKLEGSHPEENTDVMSDDQNLEKIEIQPKVETFSL